MKISHVLAKIKNMAANNLVIKGTLILTIAGFSTRILGFYNRIFLSGLIGAKEMGVYQLIFPLYMVAFALTTCGNELAVTKLVSEYKSRGDMASARAFFRVCFVVSALLSLTVCFIMRQNALWLCTHILNAPECVNCLKIICLGIPFMSMKGSIHGYFIGLEKSSVHGISDLLEQTAKIFGLYLLAAYICVRSSYDAQFAVWGIVIGEVTAFFYSVGALLIHHRKYKNCFQGRPICRAQIFRLFAKNSIPLTANRLALTVLQSIEAIMIPTVLLLYYHNSELSLATYGVFSGMAFPFIMFPSTITNSLSTMLLPAVSSANSSLQKPYLVRLCEKSLHFCLLIGIFSTITFYIFGRDIGVLFFQNKEAGMYLYQLSFLCPLIYLATTLASILNGLGFAAHNLLLTMIATVIRIGFIQLLIPKIGITGYTAGMFASYLFLSLACMGKLQKQVPIELHFQESIFLPCCVFTLLGSMAYYLFLKGQSLCPDIPAILLLLGVIGLYGLVGFLPFLAVLYRKKPRPES